MKRCEASETFLEFLRLFWRIAKLHLSKIGATRIVSVCVATPGSIRTSFIAELPRSRIPDREMESRQVVTSISDQFVVRRFVTAIYLITSEIFAYFKYQYVCVSVLPPMLFCSSSFIIFWIILSVTSQRDISVKSEVCKISSGPQMQPLHAKFPKSPPKLVFWILTEIRWWIWGNFLGFQGPKFQYIGNKTW